MNSKQTENSQEEELKNWLGKTSKPTKQIGDTMSTEDSGATDDNVQTESTNVTRPTRLSVKQKKASFEEYKEIFLHVPKLEDRKPVFISRKVRDKLDEVVRKLGGRRMSVSGFIENLAHHHLELYQEDVESWKKL